MGANRNEFIENASKILLSKSEEYKCIIDKIEHYLNELLADVLKMQTILQKKSIEKTI